MIISSHDVNVEQAHRQGVQLHTHEVMALIHETCVWLEHTHARGEQMAAPTSDELWVTPAGELRVMPGQNGVSAGDPLVGLAALIEQLLPPFSNDPRYAVRASMRLLPARLRAKAGLEPIASVGVLLQTIGMYETEEPARILSRFADRVGASPKPGPLVMTAENPIAPLPARPDALSAFASDRPQDSTGATTAAVSPIRDPALPDTPPAVAQRWRAPRMLRAAALIVLGVGLGFGLARFPRVLPWATLRAPAGALAPSASAPSRVNTDSRDADRGTNAVTQPTALTEPAAIDPLSPGKGAQPDPPTLGATTREPLERLPEAAPPPGIDKLSGSAPPAPASEARGAETAVTGGQPMPLDLPVEDGAFSPSFAATGTVLFFHAGRERGGRLLKANLNARGLPQGIVTVLADGAKNYHPRLSPDERLIAFDSDREGERAVYIADRGGSDIRRISVGGFAAIPTWSPDMKWLSFVRAEPNQPQVWNLWLRDLTAGTFRRLTSYRSGQTWGAAWFPDARRICYSHEDELVVLDIAAGTIDSFRSPGGHRQLRTPAVSPDGGRVVFQVYRDGVWLLDLQTRGMRRILDDPTAEEFAWNPQGTRIAYHSHRNGQWAIWIAAIPS